MWQRRDMQILQGYGMTEASPGVLLAVPGMAADRPLSAGVPHFFTDVSLASVGPDTQGPQPSRDSLENCSRAAAGSPVTASPPGSQ